MIFPIIITSEETMHFLEWANALIVYFLFVWIGFKLIGFELEETYYELRLSSSKIKILEEELQYHVFRELMFNLLVIKANHRPEEMADKSIKLIEKYQPKWKIEKHCPILECDLLKEAMFDAKNFLTSEN